MKLFVRGLFACAALMAGLVISGCSSTPTGQLPDNSKSRASADVARFRVGETVFVAFSGSPIEIPAHEEPIKEDGTITLPLIGAVYAAGKTAGELQNEIWTNYVPKYYVQLTVNVKSPVNDRVYYVGGQVNSHQGVYPYMGLTTVSKAVQAAGDFNDFANHTVTLTRSVSGERIQVNVDRVRAGKDVDQPVYPGDSINISKSIF